MKVILTNGAELTPILVAGGQRNVQGANRDALSFVFPASAGMEELDAAFIPANCESVTIEGDDGSACIHKAYTVRAELSKRAVEVSPGTPEQEAVTEDRIFVVMAQRTYAESQLASLTDTIDVLVMDSLMA